MLASAGDAGVGVGVELFIGVPDPREGPGIGTVGGVERTPRVDDDGWECGVGVREVGCMEDSSTSSMKDEAEGTGAGDRGRSPPFFFGARTRLRAIRFPNTARASPSCDSVPRIETWRSSVPETFVEKTLRRAPEMSEICFNPLPPRPTTWPAKLSAMTRVARNRSGEWSLGVCVDRGTATACRPREVVVIGVIVRVAARRDRRAAAGVELAATKRGTAAPDTAGVTTRGVASEEVWAAGVDRPEGPAGEAATEAAAEGRKGVCARVTGVAGVREVGGLSNNARRDWMLFSSTAIRSTAV